MPAADDKSPSYARIAVNVPRVEGVFDYHLPPELEENFLLGQLVEVPFGRQYVQGVIIEFPERPAVLETKAVHKLLDPDPVLTANQIQLGQQLAADSLSPLGITLLAMVPAGLSVQADLEYRLSDQSLSALETGEPLLPEPSPTQVRLVDLLLERGPLRGRQLDRLLESQSTLEDPSVKPKIERQLKFLGDRQSAQEQMGSLAKKGYPDALARRQAVLRLIIETSDPVPLSEIYAQTGAIQYR